MGIYGNMFIGMQGMWECIEIINLPGEWYMGIAEIWEYVHGMQGMWECIEIWEYVHGMWDYIEIFNLPANSRQAMGNYNYSEIWLNGGSPWP